MYLEVKEEESNWRDTRAEHKRFYEPTLILHSLTSLLHRMLLYVAFSLPFCLLESRFDQTVGGSKGAKGFKEQKFREVMMFTSWCFLPAQPVWVGIAFSSPIPYQWVVLHFTTFCKVSGSFSLPVLHSCLVTHNFLPEHFPNLSWLLKLTEHTVAPCTKSRWVVITWTQTFYLLGWRKASTGFLTLVAELSQSWFILPPSCYHGCMTTVPELSFGKLRFL